jgi:hypothetical protein
MSRQSFEQELARLNAVRADPGAPGAADVLRHALAARSNLLVARAAEIVGEWELAEHEAALVVAFDRFMDDAIRRDPTCAAKIAIAEALNRLEARPTELFRRGLHHAQLEPVWGGHEDTAARLRAVCALGLARCDPPDVLLELAGLLADSQTDARLGAVRAIAYATRPGGAPLLWYKAHVGDPEPAVRHECLTALLALAPEAALPFVGRLARGDDPIDTESALAALSRSRLPEALGELVAVWEETVEPGRRRAALAAIGGLGDDGAFAFLLGLLEHGGPRDAADAARALDYFHDDERRRRRVEKVMRRRGDLGAPGLT